MFVFVQTDVLSVVTLFGRPVQSNEIQRNCSASAGVVLDCIMFRGVSNILPSGQSSVTLHLYLSNKHTIEVRHL